MLRKFWVLFFILVLLLAGCGKPVEPPTSSTPPSGEIFQIALPRIVIDVDSEGNPSVLGLSPAVLKGLGVDLAGMQVPPATVEQMTKANVQHIEIASVGDRLVLLANGKPMPHLGWNQPTLQQGLNCRNTGGPECRALQTSPAAGDAPGAGHGAALPTAGRRC